MNEIIKKLKDEAYNFSPGNVGEERARKIEEFVNTMTTNYSEKLGISKEEILIALESKRDYSAINFYQTGNLPFLNDQVLILSTKEDFLKKFPSKKFVCPWCKGISTSPSVCNSGKKVWLINHKKKKKEVCNWKIGGLLGDLGKGLRLIVKDTFLDNPVVYNIFLPVELM